MRKTLPWIKWIIAVIGLYMALHTSNLVIDNYILKDQMVFVVKTGKELTLEAKESLRTYSLKNAFMHLFIIWISVLVAGRWLSVPFTKPHNKSLNSTPKNGPNEFKR
ncbi:MAG TPA: hypothetical protein VIU93_13970 [Gallionellaceae bacterium]